MGFLEGENGKTSYKYIVPICALYLFLSYAENTQVVHKDRVMVICHRNWAQLFTNSDVTKCNVILTNFSITCYCDKLITFKKGMSFKLLFNYFRLQLMYIWIGKMSATHCFHILSIVYIDSKQQDIYKYSNTMSGMKRIFWQL